MQSAETSFVEPPEAPALADPCPYLAHYGLRDVPFRVTADPRHLWLGGTHRVALDRLTAAVRDGDGIVLLTGDIGTGKTSLANGLAERLRDAGLLVGQLLNARIEASEFLQAVANAFRLAGTFDVKDEFVTRLEESGVAGACLGVLLDRARSSGRKVVLIIDEAQSLSEDCLRETAELSGLASTSGSSLVILLVAQKELSALLSDPRQEALNRRITARFTLEALEPDEVGEYIRHGLAAAGAPFEIFSAEAMHEIATLSRGAPRAINMVCDHALLTGGQRNARTITRDIIVDSGRMAQLESRAEPATVRLISFPRRRGAVVIRARRLQGRLGVPLGRGLLDTLARSGATASIALGAGVLLFAGGYSVYAGWLDGVRRHPPPSAAHAPPAVKPDPRHAAPVEVPAAAPLSEPTPSQPPPAFTSATSGVTEKSADRAAAVTGPIPPASSTAPPGGVNNPSTKSVPLREHGSALQSTATPPAKTAVPRGRVRSLDSQATSTPVAKEGRNEPPAAAAPSRRPTQASERERGTPDPTDIVDWFLKEYSPSKR